MCPQSPDESSHISSGSWLALCMQGHTAGSVLGCELSFGALGSVEASSRAAGRGGFAAPPMQLLGHACHPSVLWRADVHLTGPSFEGSELLSERLQLLPVAKYFPAVLGTEPTSFLYLSRVQGTKTCAAACCREAPCSRCWLSVGWGEGWWQALFGWAGCTSPPLMAYFFLLPGCLTISILEVCLP